MPTPYIKFDTELAFLPVRCMGLVLQTIKLHLRWMKFHSRLGELQYALVDEVY